MSYIKNNLMQDEKVIYKTGLHPLIFRKSIFLGIISMLFYIAGAKSVAILDWLYDFLISKAPKTVPFVGMIIGNYEKTRIVVQFLGIVVLVMSFMEFVSAMIKITTTEFGITNKRIIAKTGLFRRKSIEILLTKIEGIDVNQGVLGRLWGIFGIDYGSIDIKGVGGTDDPVHYIRNPFEFRMKIQEQISKGETNNV